MGRRGFTLVELMVVVVVAGLLFGLSLPSFLSYTRSLKEHGAREQLVQELRMARQTAVTAHSQIIIAFPGSTNVTTYTVLTDTDGDRVWDAGERQNTKGFPAGTYLEILTLTPTDSIIFDPSGMLAPGATGGQLVVHASDRPDTLNIGATGMVYRQ